MTPRRLAGYDVLGRQTATAGNVINALVPPSANYRTRIDELVYTAAGTAHKLTAFQELGRTTVAVLAASGQAVMTLLAQPYVTRNVAANDWLAWDNGDGTYSFGQVSSVSGLAVTMTANLGKALAVGQTVWMFGIGTDVVPKSPTGLVHPVFTLPASTRQAFPAVADIVGGFVASPPGLRFSPLLLQIDNVTAAGTLELVRYCHTDP